MKRKLNPKEVEADKRLNEKVESGELPGTIMDFCSDNNATFGDVFMALKGVDSGLSDMDLSLRVHNLLKRNGIHNLQLLLEEKVADFWNIDRREYEQIVDKLQEMNEKYSKEQ